jgi:hypothetical protein
MRAVSKLLGSIALVKIVCRILSNTLYELSVVPTPSTHANCTHRASLRALSQSRGGNAMRSRSGETDQGCSLDARQPGWRALEHGNAGDAGAVEEAIAYFHAFLEWLMPQTAAILWAEA